MKIDVRSPAPLGETLQLFTRAGIAKPLEIKTAIYQWRKSDSFAFYDGDLLVAVIGLYPRADTARETHLEIWFVCRPQFGRWLHPMRKAAHLTLAKIAESGGVRLTASVRVGHEPGYRLARLIGLERVGEANGFVIFQWAKGPTRWELFWTALKRYSRAARTWIGRPNSRRSATGKSARRTT